MKEEQPRPAAPVREEPSRAAAPVREKLGPGEEERVSVPPASRPNPWEKKAAAPPAEPAEAVPPEPPKPLGKNIQVMLNGKQLRLPGKEDGSPYYVMDLLEFSGIDFEHLDRGVELQVNGRECAFTQELRPQDDVVIRYLER